MPDFFRHRGAPSTSQSITEGVCLSKKKRRRDQTLAPLFKKQSIFLVTVVFRFERTAFLYTDIICLLICKLIDFHADFLQV